MAETTQQDGQKTIVSFIVGLLIGGMLVWAFSGSNTKTPTMTESEEREAALEVEVEEVESESTSTDEDATTTTEATATLPVGDGSVTVIDQPASRTISLSAATFPINEGWIGVRDYQNDELGFILGAVRFSQVDGLVPTEITLLRSTITGNRYAVVIFTENGDNEFNLANDVQLDQIFATFVAK